MKEKITLKYAGFCECAGLSRLAVWDGWGGEDALMLMREKTKYEREMDAWVEEERRQGRFYQGERRPVAGRVELGESGWSGREGKVAGKEEGSVVERLAGELEGQLKR